MRDNRPSAPAATAALTALGLLSALIAGSMTVAVAQDDPFAGDRRRMVEEQIRRRGVDEPAVLDAMTDVPRHMFVPPELRDGAYLDGPQPIGSGQTISQPFIVALMTAYLELDGNEKVLEIGTGSGYQAAILARLAKEVYTIEIREELGKNAEKTLRDLGFENIHFRIGDGHAGWPEAAPFDGIIVTAAPEKVPEDLIRQLKVGARLVIPVGEFFQDLLVITKTADGIERRQVAAVRFVPMVKDPGE